MSMQLLKGRAASLGAGRLDELCEKQWDVAETAASPAAPFGAALGQGHSAAHAIAGAFTGGSVAGKLDGLCGEEV